MLDSDLAELYGVETRVLNQAVRRNSERFPDDDFMIQLNQKEFDALKSQIVISRSEVSGREWGGRRKSPRVFTEQGVAMLSSVLNSKRAIQVNIQIIKTFTRLRELVASNKALRERLDKLERKYDTRFKVIFDVMKKLLAQEEEPKREIGFKTGDRQP